MLTIKFTDITIDGVLHLIEALITIGLIVVAYFQLKQTTRVK